MCALSGVTGKKVRARAKVLSDTGGERKQVLGKGASVRKHGKRRGLTWCACYDCGAINLFEEDGSLTSTYASWFALRCVFFHWWYVAGIREPCVACSDSAAR